MNVASLSLPGTIAGCHYIGLSAKAKKYNFSALFNPPHDSAGQTRLLMAMPLLRPLSPASQVPPGVFRRDMLVIE